MALNLLNIKPSDNKVSHILKGDMSVAFDQELPNNFSIRFFTITNELFTLESSLYQFYNLEGEVVNGLIVGGQPGCFLELMLNKDIGKWFIVANNLINVGSGSGAGVDTSEKTLVFEVAPTLTPVNVATGRNYRGKLTNNAKLGNPTNMVPGDFIRFILEQDIVGNRLLTYDGAYGFKDAQIPALSTVAQSVDILECYVTGDYSLICELRKNYSIIRPLAYATDFAYTVQTAITAAEAKNATVNGQTVRIIRDGYRLECNGTYGFTKADEHLIRLQGVTKPDGSFPLLRLDKQDRPAFGKALVNIEGGQVVVEKLRIAGASAYADGNGTGILINSNVNYVRIEDVHLYENENGVRSAGEKPKFDLINVYLERNGWAANPSHAGYSHSIYAGENEIWRGTNTTFYNPVAGHNIKSRALQTVLNGVYTRKCNEAREIDCPDLGLLHATDCVFWKEGDAIQNNLVAVGYELLSPNSTSRHEEYFFTNCYFHNDIPPPRACTFLENHRGGATLNTVTVHFIDCLFGGATLQRGAAAFDGPYTITQTGGPLGPRYAPGSALRKFNLSEIPANATGNPGNIPLTPFDELPAMTVTEPTPPYPTFAALETLPPLPSSGAQPPKVDVTPPLCSISASTSIVTTNQGVVLTAVASDDIGVVKVEFLRDGEVIFTDNAPNWTLTQTFTFAEDQGKSYVYSARAYDATGKTGGSAEVTVLINLPTPDLIDPEIALTSSTNEITTTANFTLTATATDNVGVAKVEFYRGATKVAERTAAPYTYTTALTHSSNGLINFSASAFDDAGNVASSDVIAITVNIPDPVTTNDLELSPDLLAASNTAMENGTTGASGTGKRLAVAQAFIDAMAPNHVLKIYRDGGQVISATFNNPMELVNDADGVGVSLGDISASTSIAADINTGIWTFVVTGGVNDDVTISGSVGPVDSGADLILEDSPEIGQVFDQVVVFMIDPSVDSAS